MQLWFVRSLLRALLLPLVSFRSRLDRLVAASGRVCARVCGFVLGCELNRRRLLLLLHACSPSPLLDSAKPNAKTTKTAAMLWPLLTHVRWVCCCLSVSVVLLFVGGLRVLLLCFAGPTGGDVISARFQVDRSRSTATAAAQLKHISTLTNTTPAGEQASNQRSQPTKQPVMSSDISHHTPFGIKKVRRMQRTLIPSELAPNMYTSPFDNSCELHR